MEISFELLGILFAVAILAGVVDAISGGGGLIVIPVLMLVGCTPAQAIATTKLQSFFGKLSAVVYYREKGMINFRAMRWPLLASFMGAVGGAVTLQYLDAKLLERIIPYLLGALAIYLFFSPKVEGRDRPCRLSVGAFALGVAPVIGYYDGFFGAASGTFFAVSLMVLLGQDIRQATASTKLLLLAANVSALGIFILGGNVVWAAGLCMAAGQWIGCHYGSRLVLRKGGQLVRPMLGMVCLLLIIKMVSVAVVAH